jgi:hypothetical protein
MQVWDVMRVVRAVRSMPGLEDASVRLTGRGEMAGIALYAALFDPSVSEVWLYDLPKSHMQGPHFLNVLRVLDMPQAVAMAAERSRVVLYQSEEGDWGFAQETAQKLRWPEKQIEVRGASAKPAGDK